MLSWFCLLCLLPNVFVSISAQEDPVVKLDGGQIKGTVETYSRKGDDISYSVFRGIPYAKAPVGSLRFKSPEKYGDFSSVFDAKAFGSNCPQWDSQGKVIGEEDCLYINVYTPFTPTGSSSQTSTTYPVMVFIHGGNFQKGSSDLYVQEKFIENEIILVTFNYRIGVLGFLSTGDGACPGNFGLKDQVLALEWVRDNIRSFGGNSSSVTLFGHGAGAVSVFLHILSPSSQGLFHRAITQSGSPLCDWTVEENPHTYAIEVAKRLSCSTKSTSAIVDCIRGKSYQDILQAQKDTKTFGDYPLRAIPVVEKGGFLPDNPAKLLTSGDFNLVPLISGINKDDGAILYPLINSYQNVLQKNSSFLLNQMIPMFLLTATDIRGNIEAVSQAVLFQYFNGIDTTNITQILQPFINMTTDAMFVSCNYRTLQSYSERGGRAYMYTFEHKGQYSMLELNEGKNLNYDGVSHGDELLYIFDFKNAVLSLSYDTRKKDQMNYLWTTFAKTGAPPTTVNSEYPKWEQYTSESRYYYKIREPIAKDTFYKQREVDFWLSHLPALATITPPRDGSEVKYEVGGFGWTMLAFVIILLIVVIALSVKILRMSKSEYSKTKTDGK